MSTKINLNPFDHIKAQAARIEALEEELRNIDFATLNQCARIEALEAALRSIVNGGTAVLISAALDECPVNPEVLKQIVKDASVALAPEQDR